MLHGYDFSVWFFNFTIDLVCNQILTMIKNNSLVRTFRHIFLTSCFLILWCKLPMMRWKRFALVAALCILAVRAVIVQLAFFLHMQVILSIFLLFLNSTALVKLTLTVAYAFLSMLWRLSCYWKSKSFYNIIDSDVCMSEQPQNMMDFVSFQCLKECLADTSC